MEVPLTMSALEESFIRQDLAKAQEKYTGCETAPAFSPQEFILHLSFLLHELDTTRLRLAQAKTEIELAYRGAGQLGQTVATYQQAYGPITTPKSS